MMDQKLRPKSRWRETWNIFFVVLIVIFVVLLATMIIIFRLKSFRNENMCLSEECVKSAVQYMDQINLEIDPCENFYNFTCGNYKGTSAIIAAQHEINKRLESFIRNKIKEDDSRSVKLQKKYYHGCMNLKAIEEDENKRLMDIYENLGGWPILGKDWNDTSFDWKDMLEKCIDNGLYYDWFFNIESEPSYDDFQDILHIKPANNVHQYKDALRKSYILLNENVVNILGSPDNITEMLQTIKDVTSFEFELAEIIVRSQENGTEKKCTIEYIKNEFPNIPWTSLLTNVVLSENTEIICSIFDYVPEFEKLIAKTPKRIQANYIFWKLTQSLHTFLSNDIRREFRTFEDLKGGGSIYKDRSKYCYGITNTVFSYVSEAHYARNCAFERKSVEKIVDNIKNVLHGHIQGATWMNETHKKYAHIKLKDIKVLLGAPEEMYNEKKFDKLLGVDPIDILNLNNTLDIVKVVDKSRDIYNLNFRKSKITYSNAKLYQGVGSLQAIKYMPEQNLMYLPAAALDGMFYSQTRTYAQNYGTLGTAVGHELAHAFGYMDSASYENGKEITWSNITLKQFFETADCVLNDCYDISSDFNITISCQETFEENFADFTGANLAYEAYNNVETKKERHLPGLVFSSYQLFWISHATTMCTNMVFKNIENVTHSLPFQRIISSYRNSEYFQKDFRCSLGSYMNPVNKCKVL